MQTHSSDLQLEEHNGYQTPLRCFVDDVCIAEPAVIENNTRKKVAVSFMQRRQIWPHKHKMYSERTNKIENKQAARAIVQ